jgi:hypothetical protein
VTYLAEYYNEARVHTIGQVRRVAVVLLPLGCKNFLQPYVEVSNITSSRPYSFDLSSPFNSISTMIIVGGGTPTRDFPQAFPNIFLILLFYAAASISINMVSYSPLSKRSMEKGRSKIQGLIIFYISKFLC